MRLSFPFRCECLPGHRDSNTALSLPSISSPAPLDCRPIDVCHERGGEACTEDHTTCVTTGPGTFQCVCKEGYQELEGECRREFNRF